MSNTRDISTSLLVLRALKTMVAEAEAAVRALALDAFDVVGMRDIGVIADPHTDSKEQLGSVQLLAARVQAAVTDPPALLAWTQANRPDEVETITRVRPAFVDAVLAAAREEGTQAYDPTTGLVIPGVTVVQGSPTLMVKAAGDAGEVVRRALAEGRLSLAELGTHPAIEGAQS